MNQKPCRNNHPEPGFEHGGPIMVAPKSKDRNDAHTALELARQKLADYEDDLVAVADAEKHARRSREIAALLFTGP